MKVLGSNYEVLKTLGAKSQRKGKFRDWNYKARQWSFSPNGLNISTAIIVLPRGQNIRKFNWYSQSKKWKSHKLFFTQCQDVPRIHTRERVRKTGKAQKENTSKFFTTLVWTGRMCAKQKSIRPSSRTLNGAFHRTANGH